MIGRRAVIGLSLLSALLFCAFAAQSASAMVVPPSTNTTAHTCVKANPVKTGHFEDEHCDKTHPKKEGEWTHSLIKIGETTTIDGTNEKVTNSTKDKEVATLKGTIGLAKVDIQCNVVKNNTKNSWIRNAEPKATEHTFEGTIETEFTDCEVKELLKCDVTEPIVSKALVHGADKFEGPKGEPNAMGIEFVGEGPEEEFATVQFTNLGLEKCSLHEKKFVVKGRVVGTNGPTTESAQNGKETGATLVFTPKFKMQTLKLGPNAAEFSTIVTPQMPSGGPIALTTTT